MGGGWLVGGRWGGGGIECIYSFDGITLGAMRIAMTMHDDVR